jgi:hypothetical protein
MVKDYLKGIKGQTQRTRGLEKINQNPYKWRLTACFLDGKARFFNIKTEEDITIKCPYGGVGDYLWWKETWWCPQQGLPVIYKANLEPQQAERQLWKSALFMPKWASRIKIPITDLRVQRLQDISENDCKLEGITSEPYEDWKVSGVLIFWQGRYAELWDKLNGKKYPCTSNPWVWVIGFRKKDKGG